MATAERETKLYELEVKRRRVKAGGGYEPFWKTKKVSDALIDLDTEFRAAAANTTIHQIKSV